MNQGLKDRLKRINKYPFFTAGLFALIIFAAALGLGYRLGYSKATKWAGELVTNIRPVRENNFNYNFIYPLLSYDFGDARQFFEDKPLEKEFNNFIQDQYKTGSAESISVYFRSFPESKWAGVNQAQQYHPGSILKVLIMVGYFREAQLDPLTLKKTFVYTKEVDGQSNSVGYSLASKLTVGKSYTILELIKAMIADSDNGAETLLLNNIDRKILNDAYTNLNLENPDSFSGDYTISPQQYTAFLRILYSATYLTDQYSEEALSIMSQSTYKDGIVAGLPAGVVAAQKYGERVNSENNEVTSIELHDCGIVYAKNPFTICVMTKGSDEQKLSGIIKGLTEIAYSYVSKE